ncbi:hypothetical protein [Pseudomonas baetica]|uniref:hypothetical protein n=1 Tax=Pseudomonas baetica TaxID=674054 RepID=UPI00240627B0|nr:hypothetical protein [Pseudomonas baetica]MDF9779034.1 hypothetical protein [Pseudomonas baetica]
MANPLANADESFRTAFYDLHCLMISQKNGQITLHFAAVVGGKHGNHSKKSGGAKAGLN